MPIIKLAGMAMRSISKPVASYVKGHLQDSPTFAKVMTNIGTGYQTCANKLTTEAVVIDQVKAIEMGSEIVVETVLFGIMASFVIYDHIGSKEKSAIIEQRLQNLENKI